MEGWAPPDRAGLPQVGLGRDAWRGGLFLCAGLLPPSSLPAAGEGRSLLMAVQTPGHQEGEWPP